MKRKDVWNECHKAENMWKRRRNWAPVRSQNPSNMKGQS